MVLRAVSGRYTSSAKMVEIGSSGSAATMLIRVYMIEDSTKGKSIVPVLVCRGVSPHIIVNGLSLGVTERLRIMSPKARVIGAPGSISRKVRAGRFSTQSTLAASGDKTKSLSTGTRRAAAMTASRLTVMWISPSGVFSAEARAGTFESDISAGAEIC